MKKLSKILVLVLTLTLAASAFVFASSAETSPFLVEGLYRETLMDAVDNADENTPIKLVSDYVAEAEEAVTLDSSLVLDLNGKTLTYKGTDNALLNVTGKNATLTIKGPGKIVADGTIVFIDAKGAKLVTNGDLDIVSSSESAPFVIGETRKATAEISDRINFSSKAGTSLFELNSSSVLNVNDAVISVVSDGAYQASGFVTLNSASKAYITNTDIYSAAGYIFKVGTATENSPVLINCDTSKLYSESSTYGTILDAGSQYVTMSTRLSEIVAGGYAFLAEDTLFDYTGDGMDKVYAKPTASVTLNTSTYALSMTSKLDATLFRGNITAHVTGGSFELGVTSYFAYGTRVWDGECGVLVEAGVRFNRELASNTASVLRDEDGALIYHDPNSTTNENFTLGTFDGKQCELYQTVIVLETNQALECYLVGVNDTPYITDLAHSKHFDNEASYRVTYGLTEGEDTSKLFEAAYFANAHSEVSVNYKGNGYLRLAFDANGKYNETSTDSPYLGIRFGHGNNANILGSSAKIYNQFDQEFITVDFDIMSDTVDANGKAVYYEGGYALMQRIDGSGYYQAGNTFTIRESSEKYEDGSRKYNLTCGSRNLIDDSSNTTVTLSPVPGEWTHITLIIDVDNSSVNNYVNNSWLHYYVNGSYVGSGKALGTGILSRDPEEVMRANPDQFRGVFKATNEMLTTENKYPRSTCFDNFVVNYYHDGYSGDLLSIRENKLIKLNTLNDVVYKPGYQFPSSAVLQEDAKIAEVDGKNYYNEDDFLNAIVDGSIVKLYKDIEEEYSASDAFTVYTNGHSFVIKSETHTISTTKDESNCDVYSVVESAVYIPVYWDIYLSYQTEAPYGVVPQFTGTLPAVVESAGKRTGLIGWSYTKDATEPDELRPISKEDMKRGYLVLYPVFDVVEVEVTFTAHGISPFTRWVKLVNADNEYIDITPEILAGYTNDMSDELGQSLEVEGQTLYRSIFSGWAFREDGMTKLGKEPANVVARYENYILTSINVSYTLEKLTMFTPKIYLGKPADGSAFEIIAVYSIETDLETGEAVRASLSASSDVFTVCGVESFEYLTSSTPTAVDKLKSKTYYIEFAIDDSGNTYTQAVTLDLKTYFENLLSVNKDDAYELSKTGIMSTVIMVDNLLGGDSEFAGIINDPAYQDYVNEFSINSVKKIKKIVDGNEMNYEDYYNSLYESNKIFTHLAAIRWDFKNSTISYAPLAKKYPVITAGWFDEGTLSQLYAYCSSAARASVSKTTLSVAVKNNSTGEFKVESLNGWKADLIHSDGGTYAEKKYGIYTEIEFRLLDSPTDGSRNTIAQPMYDFILHLLYLDDLYKGGDTSVEKEYETAKSIFMAHKDLKAAVDAYNAQIPDYTIPSA